MATKKVTTASVEVFKVKGETMKIAFNNLKQEKGFDNHHLEIEDDELLNQGNICNGYLQKSKDLYPEYINNNSLNTLSKVLCTI
jgi:hypothetical protein